MTTPVLETAPIDHLDFDEVLACESDVCVVDRPEPTHVLVWHMDCGCYHPKLICTPCAERAMNRIAQDLCIRWRCQVCRKTYLAPLREIMEVRAL